MTEGYVLADTNIIIDYWNSPTQEVADIFANEDIAICGVVKAELLHGGKDEAECEILEKALDVFPYLDFEKGDWGKLGRLLMRLRKAGLAVPLSDAMIAYIALRENAVVWTHDRHFALIQHAVPELRLYGA